MGFVVITVVGAILGWLAAGVMQTHTRLHSSGCVLAGALGALAGAWVGGRVPLSQGVSALQLLWAVLSALLVIACVTMIGLRHSVASGKV